MKLHAANTTYCLEKICDLMACFYLE